MQRKPIYEHLLGSNEVKQSRRFRHIKATFMLNSLHMTQGGQYTLLLFCCLHDLFTDGFHPTSMSHTIPLWTFSQLLVCSFSLCSHRFKVPAHAHFVKSGYIFFKNFPRVVYPHPNRGFRIGLTCLPENTVGYRSLG